MLPLALRGRILVHRRNAFDTGLEHVMKGCLKQKRNCFASTGNALSPSWETTPTDSSTSARAS